jgi:hypothetical protein
VAARSSCVLNVGDELDDHAGEECAGDHLDQHGQEREPGAGDDQQVAEDACEDEQDRRGGHQDGRLVDVDMKDPADHRPGVKALAHTASGS